MNPDWTRIVLAGCWVTLMLVYLLGDVLRIYAGHIEPGQLGDRPAPEWTWSMIAVIMLIPIAMILLSLLLPNPPLRWITIGVSTGLVLFNVSGLPYKGLYDNFLIVLSLGLNAFTAWTARSWGRVASWPDPETGKPRESRITSMVPGVCSGRAGVGEDEPTPSGSGAGEDALLLHLELGVGEYSRVAELPKLGELVKDRCAARYGSGRSYRGSHGLRDHNRIQGNGRSCCGVLCGPSLLLAAVRTADHPGRDGCTYSGFEEAHD